MMANRYMNTFRDDILGWNKKLMNVADVNQIMTEIQRTWAYLESLFIHSEEVKRELADATMRFAKIDEEVKKVGTPGCGPAACLQSACARAAEHVASQKGSWCAVLACDGGTGCDARRGVECAG